MLFHLRVIGSWRSFCIAAAARERGSAGYGLRISRRKRTRSKRVAERLQDAFRPPLTDSWDLCGASICPPLADNVGKDVATSRSRPRRELCKV